MLWAAIALPELPLSAVFRTGDEGPCAVFDGPENRPQLLSVNATAHACGVRPGQAPAAARALDAALRLRRRDAAAEAKLLQNLAAWAYGFTGMVALLPPDALLLEVGASLRLFRGWPALERRLREGLDELGHPHRLAAAPTPLGARVLADVADGTAINDEGRLLTALGHVPLAEAHLPAKAVAALNAMGLRRLRDVMRLPRPELARRVGQDVLQHIDRLRGSVADPRALYRPPDRFASRIEFDREIDCTEPLLFPLLRLTRELAAFLLARDGGVQSFDLVFEHELHAGTTADDTSNGASSQPVERIPARTAVATPSPAWRAPTGPTSAAAARHASAPSNPPEGARHAGDGHAPPNHQVPDTRPNPATAPHAAAPLHPPVGARHAGDGHAPPDPLPVAGTGDGASHAPRTSSRVYCDGTIGSTTRVHVGLLEPVRAAEALFEFARGRVERMGLDAPARALSLVAESLPPFVPVRRDLFDIRPGAGLDWPTLAERLRARLGDRAVRGFAVHPDHRPERAWREQQGVRDDAAQRPRGGRAATGIAAGATALRATADAAPAQRTGKAATQHARRSGGADAPIAQQDAAGMATDPRPRPIWLLPRALPLRGRVARLLSGPERIETGWWDGYDVRRDYYVAELTSGQRAWLYREVGSGDDWMLQGWFA